MAKIYITLKDEKFIGKDGKSHLKLWTIDRKLEGNMQLCGAMINGKPTYIDGTLPTEVDKLPRGAQEIPNDLAEDLWKKDCHYFG